MLSLTLLALTLGAPPAAGPELIGWAALPADAASIGPTSGQQIEPANARTPPFISQQPVQGFSDALDAGDGRLWVLSDNGFGAKANSADYLLRIYLIRPELQTAKGGRGRITVEAIINLRDPKRLIPFPIVADAEVYPGTQLPVDPMIREGRLLTGADFDVESFQRLPDGTFYLGDEFGPFLLHVDATGALLAAPIPLPGVASPDHPLQPPANLPRSGGFEGMGMSPDGRTLYPLLEKPVAGEAALRLYEFDVRTRVYEARLRYYRLSPEAKAVGAFTLASATRGFIIERDDGQGPAAKHKKVFAVDLDVVDKDGIIAKREVVDLLAIPNPHKLGPGAREVFRFPFWTIESVTALGEGVIAITNDNNYPFSVGRHVGAERPDDNELILIRLNAGY